MREENGPEKNKMREAGICIRPMREEDLDQVTELERENFSTPWSRKSFLDFLPSRDAIFLVAVRDGAEEDVWGYCGVLQSLDTGDITNVSVDPERKGRGIGTLLLEELIRRSREAGIQKLFLEVRESNLPANRLYEAHGFRQVGIRRHYYTNPEEDARVLCRDEEEMRHVQSGI